MYFFPFGTDAPIYHWPIVTVLMIVLNTVIFFATGASSESPLADSLILHYQHVNPFEWLTTNFMHADVSHLVGNMAFLWPFGLVVEGKLGWARFLAVYLGIGIAYGAAVQLSMFALGSHGGALGASAVIFGLIALALVWAPRNDLTVAYMIMFVRSGVCEMSIMAFSGCFLVWQVVLFAIGGFHISTAGLHLIGFGVGFPLGLLMLKLQWVDCEGWDLLSTWATGRPDMPDPIELQEDAEALAQKVAQKEATEVRRQQMLAEEVLLNHLREGANRAAYAMYRKHAGADGRGWPLPEPVLLELIEALRRERMWAESIPLLRQVIDQSPEHEAGARLKLAHVLIEVERRPRQALHVLAKLPSELSEVQKVRGGQLKAMAQRAIDEGEMEVAIENW